MSRAPADQRRPPALLGVAFAYCVLLSAFTPAVSAFYIPGTKETSYKVNATVPFSVNTLRSSSVAFPIDYKKMPFCQPKDLQPKSESIGEIIWGDRQYNSLYSVNMLQNVSCMALPDCDVNANNEMLRRSKMMERMINNFYRVYMNIDNLPAFTNTSVDSTSLMVQCKDKLKKDWSFVRQRGFPLGISKKCNGGDALLNNHLDFIIHYNYDSQSSEKSDSPGFIVVGLEVEASSIAWQAEGNCTGDASLSIRQKMEYYGPLQMAKVRSGVQRVYWTYSYTWQKSNLQWGTRWDWYLTSAAVNEPANHILSIILAIVVVLFIGSSVFCLLLRALHKDFNRYNSEDPEDLQEETGWKLIHADVFRPPFYANWLAIFVANGCQVISTVTIVLMAAMLGLLSPSRRGALVSAMLFTAVFTSIIGGYVCGVLLQYLNCRAWKHIFLCSLTLPGGLLLTYLFTSTINAVHGATTAVPLATLLQIVVLMVAVSLPLTVLGGSIAFRQQPITNPTHVGRLAREIPQQNFLNRPLFMYSFFPCVPLIVVMVEVYYIMQDLWAGQIYYSFGFLAMTALIWAMVCALVTISCLYYVLCFENHRWWWVAYIVPGGAGLHMFFLCMFFFAWQLNVVSFASTVLFFVYMGALSYMYGLAAGAIGVATSIIFVRQIYASIKID
ncbi:putative mitochondrial endosomal integral membrane protein [Leptomonas pyrrhocoris]|uniref:Transmembrane 9 superfamily member n=1 Tax=Leptomonas pyrrhocoris TaxID=157538 RepID=A0A0N0DVL4_LEPPY|nr:putative mitochondrial endosomal integral membrane protein [Leptomonas pyrrhocoris]XP_015658974.1 putative mitochondrial endosomal integral membrane protein [Leptomonas pyrrhocoris]KPA80534.1 putative mitochondrial endosomal integral membrane protein [Leptomonas pyrrhocoris]KPA80535.1 putative mitochondrial endosomal integral membrane protein [Leptomonas pyrrhocoris]|eukprot:XP_015658973.1 putative mitochondrial endosomal integral membrane protein [Leptomonas pyrrhocoris]